MPRGPVLPVTTTQEQCRQSHTPDDRPVEKKLDLAWNAMEADEPLQNQLRLEIGLPA